VSAAPNRTPEKMFLRGVLDIMASGLTWLKAMFAAKSDEGRFSPIEMDNLTASQLCC